LLHGQSLCDLSLSDPNSIQMAFKNMKAAEINDIKDSTVEILCRGDKVRKETF
jgi:hypothetical protein